jgi:Zn-dependent protease
MRENSMDLLSKFLYNLNMYFNITSLLISLPGIIVALTVHECGHALSAYFMGDDTARRYGRLTLNPIAHIDPLGFLCLIVTRRFGWAKPVPVNDLNFKNRKKGMLLVSLAGPLSNFFLALIIAVLYRIIYYNANTIVLGMLQAAYIINLGLGVFNLLPIPPLDGSKILDAFLTSRQRYALMRYSAYSNIIIILLVFTGIISKIIGPVIIFVDFIINRIIGLFI